jgi:aminoglycoside phosphotransferase (APT) family kinase protein
VSNGRITIDAARTFLADRYGGEVRAVVELRGGYWSSAFAFRLDGRDLVARFGRWREDYEKDRAAMAFAGPDLPVPGVLEIGDAFDGAYAISERRFGVFLEELDAEGFQLVLPALMRALDAMRSVPLPPDARGVPWDAWLRDLLIDHPGGRVSGWRQRIAASSELEGLFVAGQNAFEKLVDACPDIQHVLHLDLINRNVLVAADRAHLEAVFDWGCLSYGDFLYDVAWFTFWAPWHPGLAATDIRGAVLDHYSSTSFAVENFDERIRCYELHIGVHHLAYNTFVPDAQEDLAAIASRLRELI